MIIVVIEVGGISHDAANARVSMTFQWMAGTKARP